MREFKLPLSLKMGKVKAKNLPLNLNHYRNAHFRLLNNMKIEFKNQVKKQFTGHSKLNTPIQIDYKVFPKTKRKFDVANVLSIVDKYFCDALVEEGLIEDDNCDYLLQVTYSMGVVDKDNPRVEATIREFTDADYNQPN